mmetsp:Transcript_24778/g.44812  ORF Transcript_24778/g.44812 Transcript_24778/m.44812 type:complete len:222 (-) Transcript_24778:202-867(-)
MSFKVLERVLSLFSHILYHTLDYKSVRCLLILHTSFRLALFKVLFHIILGSRYFRKVNALFVLYNLTMCLWIIPGIQPLIEQLSFQLFQSPLLFGSSFLSLRFPLLFILSSCRFALGRSNLSSLFLKCFMLLCILLFQLFVIIKHGFCFRINVFLSCRDHDGCRCQGGSRTKQGTKVEWWCRCSSQDTECRRKYPLTNPFLERKTTTRRWFCVVVLLLHLQ